MRIHSLCFSLLLLVTSACAPLHPHGSAWGNVGEVAGRVLLCPLTLCTSELILYSEHQAEERRFAYARWYNSLSPAQREQEDRREAARLQALGMALSGGGPRFTPPTWTPYAPPPVSVPPPMYQPAPVRPLPPVSCTSRAVGQQLYTDCY